MTFLLIEKKASRPLPSLMYFIILSISGSDLDSLFELISKNISLYIILDSISHKGNYGSSEWNLHENMAMSGRKKWVELKFQKCHQAVIKQLKLLPKKHAKFQCWY